MDDITATDDGTTTDGRTALGIPGYSLWQLVRYMLGLGTRGFGGSAAPVGYM